MLELSPWPGELFCHGSWIDTGPAVSIVGARAASRQGMQNAYDLAQGLAKANVRVISGGALGIDGAAHRGALAGGGYTAAIMACGLDQYYPKRHTSLFEAMLENGGAVVSPFEPGYPPLRANFVRRNSLIAVLADIVVVVEASTRSGSLHTARLASRYGRNLLCFDGSSGCAALVARGVERVAGAADVITILQGGIVKRQEALPELSPAAQELIALLSPDTPLDASSLGHTLKLPVRQIHRLVIELSLESLAIALPGQRYIRSPLGQEYLKRCHEEGES